MSAMVFSVTHFANKALAMKDTENYLREEGFFDSDTPSSPEAREAVLNRSILSVSGLRFICSDDENDLADRAAPEVQEFALSAVYAQGKLVLKNNPKPVLWLGMDTRPTGRLFCYLAARLLQGMGIELRCTGHSPIPELMAATHQSGADGFCYFTASPPCHLATLPPCLLPSATSPFWEVVVETVIA